MRTSLIVAVAAAVVIAASGRVVTASGPAAIYAIVQKVVLEPSETSPERIQVWGVFSIWDAAARTYSEPGRGYMYFKLPGPSDVQWRGGGNQPSVPNASRYRERRWSPVPEELCAPPFSPFGQGTPALRP